MSRLPLSFIVGSVLTFIFVFAAVLSFFWTPYDVTLLDIAGKFQVPSMAHLFGTDHFGRDIFSMIMVGARNAIAVSLVAVGIGMAIGVPLGLWAAATKMNKGHIIDEMLMRG
ncbi:MAG: ABC transporter permease, partial [Kordiimonadaceae bacterium]|nr:ABC transporter permease [Kordiimonadaceae bacterium]